MTRAPRHGKVEQLVWDHLVAGLASRPEIKGPQAKEHEAAHGRAAKEQ